jgi:hypothetical protein
MEGAHFQEAKTEQRGNMKSDQRSRKQIKRGPSKNRSADEAAIRDLIENWAKAVRTRNLDGILDKQTIALMTLDNVGSITGTVANLPGGPMSRAFEKRTTQ